MVFKMSKITQIISVLVILLMGSLLVGASSVNRWINEPLALEEDYILEIKKGYTLSKLAYQLERENILPSARFFLLYARITEKTKLEIGEYLLVKGSSQEQLLNLLQSDNVLSYTVTLVEGKTFNDFLTALHAEEKIQKTLDITQENQALLQALAVDKKHPEGWFFPDTYQYVSGMTDKEILQQAYEKMERVLKEEWDNKSENLPYKTPYDALIMASIIEKETGVAYERAEIAGVFVRRLQKGMRLQTDPTIIYGLGDAYKGNIRRKHLVQYTPYNTYMIDGLPPTPIAMPGREAIHAALNPKLGEALYFVAKGDGSHYFSATLAEHNKAVVEYQIKKRSKQYRSSPK